MNNIKGKMLVARKRSMAIAVNVNKIPLTYDYFTKQKPCLIPAGTAVLCIDTGLGPWSKHAHIIYKELTWIVDSSDYGLLDPSENFLGKSFCFTGVMSNSREFYKVFVELHSGTFSSKVTKNLTALVVSDITSSSTKAIKARNIGVTCITEKEFLKMLQDINNWVVKPF